MLVHISSIYAAMLAIIWFALFAGVGRLRAQHNVTLGDGGRTDMILAIRRYMNFVECVPLALLLVVMVDLNGGAAKWVHALGAILVIARIVHPFGLSIEKMNTPARLAGAGGTVFVALASAITLIVQFFQG